MAKKKEVALTEEEKELQVWHSDDKLNKKQELFCQTFATKWALFGNWVRTYIEVYSPNMTKPNRYKTACSTASEILSYPKVYKRINQLLEEDWLNDVEVDKQHKYLIEQQVDLWVKMRAIDSYNKLKQRMEDKIKIEQDITIKYDL